MASVIETLTAFLDTIPGERRTPDNCQIRNYCEANKAITDGMTGLQLVATETVFLRDLFALPDWHILMHCSACAISLKDWPEPRKTIHQLHCFSELAKSTENGRDWVVNSLLQKHNADPTLLSPKAALAAQAIILAGARSTRLIGLMPEFRKMYAAQVG